MIIGSRDRESMNKLTFVEVAIPSIFENSPHVQWKIVRLLGIFIESGMD